MANDLLNALQSMAAGKREFAGHAEKNRDGWFATMPPEISESELADAAVLEQAADRIASLEASLREAGEALEPFVKAWALTTEHRPEVASEARRGWTIELLVKAHQADRARSVLTSIKGADTLQQGERDVG